MCILYLQQNLTQRKLPSDCQLKCRSLKIKSKRPQHHHHHHHQHPICTNCLLKNGGYHFKDGSISIESQRIYPSVPMIGRTTTEDLEIDGFKISNKHTVALIIGSLHRDPEYFPDPLVYKPDRFLAENMKNRHAYAFIPFSAGRRNCIGQKFAIAEEKTLLSCIFRRFLVESTQAEADLHPEMGLVLRPKYGIKVKVTKR